MSGMRATGMKTRRSVLLRPTSILDGPTSLILPTERMRLPMKAECEHGLDTRLPCGDCQKAYEAENALEQETHKSQPDDLPLRSGVIGVGGAVDIQRPTAAPLPVSNAEGQPSAERR